MKKNGKKLGNRMMSWGLTLIMVLSLVMVPAGKVEAETVTVSGTGVITATDSGVYVSYTSELEFAANVWGTGSPAVDLYQYSFTLHNNTGTTISDWEVRITPNSDAYWNSGWNGASYDSSTGDVVLGTYKGTGDDGSTWSTAEVAAGSTVTGMGAQCRANLLEEATIELTYSVGSSTQAPSVDDTATDPSTIGSTSDKVTAKVTQTSQSYDYYQYEIAVNNGLSETISDWVVAIPVTGITSSSAWDGSWAKVKWSYDDSYIYVTSNSGETIPAGGTLSGESYKIQYNGSAALSTSEAVVYYKTGSSSTGVFDSVISGGTQPSGGSSSGSGSSSGGETFDGSNIGSIDTSLDYNFAKLLQYSLYFYDANMCGDQVSETSLYSKDLYNGWRGDCHVNDSFTYNGKTYSAVGGYHDAGDHVKFGLPMSQAMTALGMSYYEFGKAFDELGQRNHLKTITDYYCTYVKSCTVLNAAETQAEAFCYQIGDGNKDHASWVAPEVENESTETGTNRAYTLVATSSNPATDIVAGTAAALTLNYMNFGDEEDLKYAKALFAFAKNNSKAVADYQSGFYHSDYAQWQDEYCLAAALLYKVTGDSSYAAEYTSNDANNGNIEKPYGWENAYQAAVFYAPSSSSNKTTHTSTIQSWFNSVAKANSSQYYCGDSWGSARVNCNVQFMMLVSDNHAGTNTYGSWCRYQMSQILGNNSTGKNLVCGYNTNSPTKPHHRAASGYSGWTDFNNNATQKYTLYGALCGGPTNSNFSTYNDVVTDATSNEVAMDYNACLVGSAAALYLLYKNSTDAGFTNQAINADFYGGSNFTLAGGSSTVEVTSVTLDASTMELYVGDTDALTATVLPEGATNKTVTWTSSDTSVATVSGGNVTAKKAGTTTITAKAGGKSATCIVTVKNVPTANLQVLYNSVEASQIPCKDITYGEGVLTSNSVVINNAGDAEASAVSVSLEKGNSIFKVTAVSGETIAAGGSKTIYITPVAGLQAGSYTDNLVVTYDTGKMITVPVSLTVTKRAITVKANNQSKVYKDANPDMTGSGAYSVTSGSVVSGDSLDVTLSTTATEDSEVGTYDIVIRLGSNPNYSITTEKGTLNVTQKAVTEILFPTASDITVGDTLAKATLNGGNSAYGSYAWKDKTVTPSRGSYMGDVVLTLSDCAKKNYSFDHVSGYDASAGTITQQVSVNVKRAGLPDITFPTASDLQYGQTLSDSVLTGGSTAYGTFTWVDGSVTMTETQLNNNNGYNSYDVVFTWNDASKTAYGILDTDEDATMTKKVTVKVTKADRKDVPSTAVLTTRTANSIKLQTVDGVQYSLDNSSWQDSAANTTPLQVYTLVADPYTIDVGKVADANYMDALRTVNNGTVSDPTATYANGVLTLNTADKTYTIMGSNHNVTVQAPYGNTVVVLSNATVKNIDVSDATSPVIRVNGTATVEKIISTSNEEVTLTGDGTWKVTQIVVSGNLLVNGPTVVADATGTGAVAISAANITISAGKVTATGGDNASGMQATGSVTITGGEVVATGGAGAPAITGETIIIENCSVTAMGGSGAAAMETIGDNGGITIKNASLEVNAGEGSDKSPISSGNITLVGDNTVSSSTGSDNIYSSTPKDENGNVLATYTVTFLDEDGKTELDTITAYAGGKITLPEIEEEDGYILTWKEKNTSKKYKPDTFYTVSGDVTFIVDKVKILITKITLDSTAETIEVGDGVALAETVIPENAYDTRVTWDSSNTAVATVTQEGEVTGVAPGTVTITVKANDGSGISATCKVTVVNGEPEEISVEKIKITGDTKKVAPGKKLKLSATVYPDNATNKNVKWKVSNSKYASVNSKGVVTTKKAGKGKKVTVTAYSTEDDSIKATYTISIMKNAVKKIKLSAKTKTIKKGQSVTIKAKFTPSKGISKELTWTSSNKKVAIVNTKGKVTGKKKGTVKITAKAKDGSGKKATIKIKVK